MWLNAASTSRAVDPPVELLTLSLTIKKGAYFEGRAAQAHAAKGRQPDATTTKVRGEAQKVGAAAE
jgi:hypothetical protein